MKINIPGFDANRNVVVKLRKTERSTIMQVYTDYKAEASRQLNATAFCTGFNLQSYLWGQDRSWFGNQRGILTRTDRKLHICSENGRLQYSVRYFTPTLQKYTIIVICQSISLNTVNLSPRLQFSLSPQNAETRYIRKKYIFISTCLLSIAFLRKRHSELSQNKSSLLFLEKFWKYICIAIETHHLLVLSIIWHAHKPNLNHNTITNIS